MKKELDNLLENILFFIAVTWFSFGVGQLLIEVLK